MLSLALSVKLNAVKSSCMNIFSASYYYKYIHTHTHAPKVMSSVHIPVHSSDSMEDLLEDPFDDELELTFPPMRYCATYYPRPASQSRKLRRESSMERARLYRELVGHDPYLVPKDRSEKVNSNDFRVSLDVKHYRPEEITLKVDGQSLRVSGKHHNATESGYESSEFQRNYTIPENINTRTLTSTITPDGVLIIKAVAKVAEHQEMTILSSDSTSNKFEITLDVSGYKPGEISIHVNDRHLIVNAETKEETTDEHGQSAHHKRFERHFSLPADVDCDSLSSRYREGKITIEAPRKEVTTQMRTLEIKEE